MRETNVPTQLCAEALGVSPATIRRLSRPPSPSHQRPRAHDTDACRRVREVVRETHGVVGAANLGRLCRLPRRICAGIKRRELREMEIERKAACARVIVAAPQIIRGFDAMHVESREGRAYWLVAADAAVPYRTSIATVTAYDAESVVAALRRDFENNGPPLVLRLDRISCQRTLEVERLLAYYDVLALHGPPRHPQYYGQLERQNREHSDWYRLQERVPLRELGERAEVMRTALNTLWLRPSLNGWSAEQAWHARTTLDVNRRELRADVDKRTRGLVTAGIEVLRARRIAIESALMERQLLSINQGGWR